MRCWRCDNRDEANELGLCHECDDELHAENTIPPGKQLLASGTLPEAIGPYKPPPPSAYVTYPTGMVEVTEWVPEPAATEARGYYHWVAEAVARRASHQSIAAELLDL